MNRRLLLLVAMLCTAGCYPARAPVVPMPMEVYAEAPDSDTLVVMLPGIQDHPRKFGEEDFPDRIEDRPFRIVAPDSHYGYFRDRSLVTRLREDVVERYADGNDRLIFVGISLGGLGALRYWCDTRDPRLETIVLLAPFLGESDIIADVQQTGVANWEAGRAGRPFERELWSCLTESPWSGPRLVLGYGTRDEMVQAHRLIAELIPADRVYTVDGGHDWGTWKQLWRQIARSELRAAGSDDAGLAGTR